MGIYIRSVRAHDRWIHGVPLDKNGRNGLASHAEWGPQRGRLDFSAMPAAAAAAVAQRFEGEVLEEPTDIPVCGKSYFGWDDVCHLPPNHDGECMDAQAIEERDLLADATSGDMTRVEECFRYAGLRAGGAVIAALTARVRAMTTRAEKAEASHMAQLHAFVDVSGEAARLRVQLGNANDVAADWKRHYERAKEEAVDCASCTGRLVHDEFTVCPVHDERSRR